MLPRFRPTTVLVLRFLAAGLLVLPASAVFASSTTLLQARAHFQTNLLEEWKVGEPPPEPPAGVLELVSYPGPLGDMAAYRSPDPGDGKRHPAIIWLVGGFSNSISEIAWTPGPRKNDQSATGFRERGILMLYPSLRGGNTNPGLIEACYGEVDDVLAAGKYLASLDYVDPQRIFLGGHSTGGTLALLVAETGTDLFRAVFSLGPVDRVSGYGQDVLPYSVRSSQESFLRAPIRWLASVRCPTYVFEGATGEVTNIESLRALDKANINPLIHLHPIPRGDHFTIIAPLIEELSAQILADTGATASFDFSTVAAVMKR